jgi:hypothetical protein
MAIPIVPATGPFEILLGAAPETRTNHRCCRAAIEIDGSRAGSQKGPLSPIVLHPVAEVDGPPRGRAVAPDNLEPVREAFRTVVGAEHHE